MMSKYMGVGVATSETFLTCQGGKHIFHEFAYTPRTSIASHVVASSSIRHLAYIHSLSSTSTSPTHMYKSRSTTPPHPSSAICLPWHTPGMAHATHLVHFEDLVELCLRHLQVRLLLLNLTNKTNTNKVGAELHWKNSKLINETWATQRTPAHDGDGVCAVSCTRVAYTRAIG